MFPNTPFLQRCLPIPRLDGHEHITSCLSYYYRLTFPLEGRNRKNNEMNAKQLLFTVLFMGTTFSAFAYSFSAVAPSGQTLYYNITDGNARVTYPGGDYSWWTNYTKPEGELIIPATVTYNGTEYSVTSIGGYAFRGCSGLTSVTIPSSVASIGILVFEGCSGLTSVTIPSSVTSISGSAFYNVRHIEYYGSATGSPWGAISMNGITDGDFVFSDATKHYLLAYIGAGGDVTIPSTVDTIGNNAFYGCSGLTSVTIPSSVTSIGEHAFRSCSGLTSITIPTSVTSIGDDAFGGCSGLTSITIPSSVTSIGYHAFTYCSSLATTIYTGTVAQWCNITFSDTNANPLYFSHSLTIDGAEITNLVIPEGVTSISRYAFYGCSGLTSVTIPSSVTSIGGSAFYGCSGLTSVTISEGVTSIGGSAFSGCSGLTSVTIPSSVTTIGDGAFSGCSGLTSITIPSSVTSIGYYAFSYCSSLASVTIPSSVTSIGYSAFSYCSGLTSITIPSSVTTIGDGAFSGCSGLTSITIPSSVTSIGSYTFYHCSGLTSVTIPSSVTSIGYDAFYGCSGIAVMKMKPTVPPSLGNLSSINDGIIDLVVPRNSYTAYVNAGDKYTRHRIYCDTVCITVNVNDTVRGYVIGYDSVYPYPAYLDTITVMAISNHGYHFNRWESNDTCSVRRLTNITVDVFLTAYFDKNKYTIYANADTSIHGYINAPAQSNYLDEVSLSAIANHGYHFTHWQDGNTDNPRTFFLTQDTHFVAYYDKNVYTLTFQSGNSDMGIVNTTSVSSEYLDTTMQIYATAIPHHHFVKWSDNNTENPRRFVFDDNRTYTAYFAIDEHTVSVQADNLAHGTVSGAGTREYGQPITVSATPYSGYQFAHWSDGSTYNPYTFAVLEDKSLTAIFIADGEPWQDTVVVYDTAYITLHDTTYINMPVHDTTYIAVHDTTYITVTDTLWLTQADTVWLHDTVIVHDTVYITQEGIGDVDALNAKVYSSQGQIVVEGANGNMVMFYDVNGHMLATKRDEYAPLRFDAPVSGTYMIKIGKHPARKMVVVR